MEEKMEQQFTLEQINNMLETLEDTEPQRITQVVKTVLPQFEAFLKARPISQEEANEIFQVYLQIRYNSKKIDPNNRDEDYQRDWIVVQMNITGLLMCEWLAAMFECLRDVKEYLQVNKVLQKENPIDWEEIERYMDEGDFFIDKEKGKLYVHLDEDRYNEFGLELKEGFF